MAGRKLTCGLLMVLISLCASCDAETTTNGNQEDKSVTIPLDQIWAWQMPGTLPMQVEQRDGGYVAAEGPLLDEIRRVLIRERSEGTGPIQWKDAKPGFAVLGTGMDALREAHAVLVKKQEPRKSLPVDAEITLVFFSNRCGSYVHLVGVEQRGEVIQLSYRFVPHRTHELTAHIALIPVSNTKIGTIRVEVKPQIDTSVVATDLGPWIRRIVCRSFVFDVLEE